MGDETEERDYLWNHFEFNSEQRIKAFNFFVIFSVFANGGVFAAIEKAAPWWVVAILGAFVAALATVFWVIDARSKELLDLAVPGLIEYEKRFEPRSRLFARDQETRSRFWRYTAAFRALFIIQLAFGIGIAIYAGTALMPHSR